MKSRANQLDESQLADLIVILAVTFGALLRLSFPLMASFPLNDGGLFYTMIRDLQANHYLIPAVTTYNHAQIPFAYPPIGFYIAGILNNLTHIDLVTILRILPAIVSAAIIPAFYILAKEFLPKTQAALATLLFAFIPRIFAWQIMGGGITRSFGFLFAILTLISAKKLLSTHAARLILWTSIWSALTIMTHPEAIPQTALTVLILYLFIDRSKKGLVLSLIAAALIILFTAPWWGSVIARHGFTPFLTVWTSASGDSNPLLLRPIALFQFMVTDEPFLAFAAFFGIIGLFYNLAQRKYFLPVWMALPYILDPRSGPLYMMIPLTMMGAQTLMEVILPRFGEGTDLLSLFRYRVVKVFSIGLVLYLLIAGYFSAEKIFSRATLPKAEREAMAWIQSSTSGDSTFIVITGRQALLDPTADWFPALTERDVVTSAFGYEWTSQFRERVKTYQAAQLCKDQNVECLAKVGVDFDYVYLTTSEFSPLKADLLTRTNYQKKFENEGVIVFEKKQ
jgi:hypothetical protein